MKNEINYLSLFSGIGGFEKGLLQAGFKFKWHGFSEIDKYAKQIYQKHFPDGEDLDDVRRIKTDKLIQKINNIDLITFGFPCQDLSIAGKRGGITASRSSLFFEAMRIIRDTKPDYFIFENVKGLFSSNGGFDWLIVLREIADSGYDGQWQLLNTRWFLPQNRERIYFVGYIRGKSRPEVFPIGEDCGKTLLPNQVGYMDTKFESSSRVYDTTQAVTINSEGGGWGAKTGLYEIRAVLTPDRENKRQHGRRTKEDGEPMFTLTGQDIHGVQQQSRIRRLTPIECERLQGFPDGWTEGISDVQRYKTLGNAVSVPVVETIGKKLRVD